MVANEVGLYSSALVQGVINLFGHHTLIIESRKVSLSKVQILVSIALAERFPYQCDKWHSKSHGAHTLSMQDLTERKEKTRKEVVRGVGFVERVTS